MIHHLPDWLDRAWIRRCLRHGVSADLAQTDGHLDLLPSWDTGRLRLDDWLLYRIDTGTVTVTTDHTQHHAGAGEVVLIPAGCAFRSRCASHNGCRIARCRLGLPGRGGRPLQHALGASPAISEVIDLAARPDAACQAERVAGLLVAALAPLLDQPPGDGQPFTAAQRRQLEAWCAAHVRHRPEPSDIARLLGLSLDYCSRRFRRTYGCAPRRWLLQQRLRQVAVALREGDSDLDTIARSFGYVDQNLMGRQFRAVFGCSPARYRRQTLPQAAQRK